jgi:tetratricopeptide (TPR) repeat protein
VTTTTARRFRLPGDRTDRLFARAERLAGAWRFDDAERAFAEAIRHEPGYAHLYLYQGLAVAELDRYDDALRLVDQGARLDPGSAVFPMYAGCIHLDEGRRDPAAEAFERAAALAPDNLLIASYRLLTAWMAGDAGARAALAGDIAMMPDGFKARLLVAVGRGSGAQPGTEDGPRGTLDAGGPAAPPGTTTDGMRARRVERRARRLVAREQFEAAVELIQSSGVRKSAGLQSIEASATASALARLDQELTALERSPAERGSGRNDARRRDLLLRLANLRVAEPEAQYRDLDRWMKSVTSGGKPKGEDMLIPQVLAAMADAEYRSGRVDAALALCQQSRAAGGTPEVDWVEAQAHRDAGRRRLARRLFERFVRVEPLLFSERVELVLTGS